MTRLELITHVLAYQTRTPKFSAARAAFAAAAAQNGEAGATRAMIASRLGRRSEELGSTIDRMVDAGVFKRVAGAVPMRFAVTAEGLELLAPLLQTTSERRVATVAAVGANPNPTH